MNHIFDGTDELRRLDALERKLERENSLKAEQEKIAEDSTWKGYEPPKTGKPIRTIISPRKQTKPVTASAKPLFTRCQECDRLMDKPGVCCSRSCSGKYQVKIINSRPPQPKPPPLPEQNIVTYCNECDRPMYKKGTYCSRSCSGKAQNRVINRPGYFYSRRCGVGRKKSYVPEVRQCLNCGKSFDVPRTNRDQKYCDRKCSNIFNRDKIDSNQTWLFTVVNQEKDSDHEK